MKEIQPGKYQAKIIDYGIGETKNKDPQIMVMFEVADKDGDFHELTWYGTLKPGRGQEITMDALLACGMRGNDIELLAEGIPSGVLDADTPVALTVEREPKQDGKGTFAKVAWVNRIGGKAFREKLDKSSAKSKLAGLNVKATLMARRAETGIQDKPRTAFPTSNEDEDLPF